jgi:hypothetical protein
VSDDGETLKAQRGLGLTLFAGKFSHPVQQQHGRPGNSRTPWIVAPEVSQSQLSKPVNIEPPGGGRAAKRLRRGALHAG